MPGYRFGTLRPPHPTTASVRKFLEAPTPDDLHLGAFIDGRLVASAGLHRSTGRRRHVAAFGIGVADDVRRQGIGGALTEAVIDAADNWLDIKRIELTVFHDNEEAIRLYEKHGFVREGAMRSYAFREGSYVDVIAMARLKGS
jgi:putative acetyltransferase